MGRTLDALKQTEGPRPPAEDRPPAPLAVTPPPDEESPADEIPFIEVGPRRSMEASPCVLAAGPPPTPAAQRPIPVVQESAQPSEPATPAPPALPWAVAFRAPPAPARRSRLAPELVAYHDPGGAVSAQYRQLLAAVLGAAGDPPGGGPPVLLFTAARPGAGATTVLLNVAVTAARRGRCRVLVLDANPRRPALAARLGLADAPGLREVLAGAVGLDRAVQQTEQADLLALPAGDAPAAGEGGTRFVAETMRSLLRQVRQRFDLVLVDGPAWDGRAEVADLAAACDAVYLVAPAQEAESRPVDDLLRRIPEQGARLAGCILAG